MLKKGRADQAVTLLIRNSADQPFIINFDLAYNADHRAKISSIT